MVITDELFASFIRCETKSYLIAHIRDAQYELLDLQHRIFDDYIEKCRLRLVARAFRENFFVGTLSPEVISSRQYSLIFDCALGSQTIQSKFHALTRSTSAKGKPETYIPIR